MNDSNNKSDLLREIAIFDYVSGKQSDSAKRNFERLLEQDPALREAVEAEQQLRENMHKAGQLEPVSMSNFDALLSSIEKQEAEVEGEAENYDNQTESNVTPVSFSSKPALSSYFAMAASVAAIAIVFGGFYQSSSAPEFETLSNTPASEKIDFTQLTAQARLAKMTLDTNLSQQEIDELVSAYNLNSFESGAQSNHRYVISESAISEEELARWRKDVRIMQVELFDANDEG